MLAQSCGSQHLRLPAVSSSKRQPRLACIRQQNPSSASRVSSSNSQHSCSSSFKYQQQRPTRPSLALRARGKDSYKSWIGAEESQASVDEPQDQQEFAEAPTTGSLEISKISSNVRDRVESAMETLNCRATVGDVAGAAGLKVEEAEAALNALAADTLGTLQVHLLSIACTLSHEYTHNFLHTILGTICNSTAIFVCIKGAMTW